MSKYDVNETEPKEDIEDVKKNVNNMRFAPTMKLACHKELLDYIETKRTNSPINVEISPTGFCNANCSWCFYREDGIKREFIPTDILLKLLKEMKEMGVKAVSWTGGGEPTLHQNFGEIVKYANALGLKQGLFTNALADISYDPKMFEWIRVSKTDKEWPVENIKKLRKCNALGLCINYTGNKDCVTHALEISKEIKVDYVQVRPALKKNGEKVCFDIPKIEGGDENLIILNYKFKESGKDKDYKKCMGFHFVPFIWENGDVAVCAYHRGNKKFVLGNIYKNSIKDIWKSIPEYVDVVPNCQICCKNHEINKFINQLELLKDVNFV